MAVNVSQAQASRTLLNAYNDKRTFKGNLADKVTKVLRGKHVTFRYIMFTGILSKATCAQVDPLSLQAGDNSNGAYDARSICHGVVVPFERAYVKNSLGGSNEPFLNKPARFLRLDPSNACRRGTDRDLMQTAIDVLSACRNKEIAYKLLCHATNVLKDIHAGLTAKYSVTASNPFKLTQSIYDYCMTVLTEKHEGESCALVVGAVEHFSCPAYNVQVHKVNEAGASSKEVGDIDIYHEDNIVSSIEVKDKNFTKEDVQHAIEKFQEAGLQHTLFVYGLDVNFDKTEVYTLAREKGQQGCFCSILSVTDYMKVRMLAIDPELPLEDFVNYMLSVASEIRAKDDTVNWIKECLSNM